MRCPLQRELIVLDARQIEQILEQAGKAFALSGDALECSQCLIRIQTLSLRHDEV